MWGTQAGFDAEQQLAFEILASTYVLSFLNEAEKDHTPTPELMDEIESLQQLARQKDQNQPMVLFITGPAGAGKCKLLPLNLILQRYDI